MNISGSKVKHQLNPNSLPNNNHSRRFEEINLQLERENSEGSGYLREK